MGKTYAMLSAARKRQDEGRKVLVGVVETHGCSETAALLEGLELLPPRSSITKATACASSTSTPRSSAIPI
jgi:K+-sensing histidine kinase KdpD